MRLSKTLQQLVYALLSSVVAIGIIWFVEPSFNLILFLSAFLLSLLLLPLYIGLVQSGWLEKLKLRMVYVQANLILLFFLFCIFLLFFLNSVPGEFPHNIDNIYLYFMYAMALPTLLILSPLAFVLHGKKFANTWLFTLAIMNSFVWISIPVIWLPMLIYYPIMVVVTNFYRKKLIKEKIISENVEDNQLVFKIIFMFFVVNLVLFLLYNPFM
ncbi:hypothetical protein [Thiomicrorhabdus arctica]|uniref:hypothetical protein n=1 Tax=Thiomicrorhabdus arctica TaxID=131540 RepID=UPI000362BBEF|nr:hypothetical protein [Thiomicrorhabdus arctica]